MFKFVEWIQVCHGELYQLYHGTCFGFISTLGLRLPLPYAMFDIYCLNFVCWKWPAGGLLVDIFCVRPSYLLGSVVDFSWWLEAPPILSAEPFVRFLAIRWLSFTSITPENFDAVRWAGLKMFVNWLLFDGWVYCWPPAGLYDRP